MKTFVLVPVGFKRPTRQIMHAWIDWFESIKAYVIDSGNPFGEVREVTRDRTKRLPRDENAITGYIVIKAKDMDEAVGLVERCPIVTSMRIYEAEML